MAHQEYSSLAGAGPRHLRKLATSVRFLLNPPEGDTFTSGMINCVRGNSHFSHFGRKGVR